jgi:hypothetical protein
MNYKNIFLVLSVFVLRSGEWSYIKEHAQAFEKFKQRLDNRDVIVYNYPTAFGKEVTFSIRSFFGDKEIKKDVQDYIKIKDKLDDEIALRAGLAGFASGCLGGACMGRHLKPGSFVEKVFFSVPLSVLLYFKYAYRGSGTNDVFEIQKNKMGVFTSRFWRTGLFVVCGWFGGSVAGALGVQGLGKVLKKV